MSKLYVIDTEFFCIFNLKVTKCTPVNHKGKVKKKSILLKIFGECGNIQNILILGENKYV
jgi:hypothetical protein